MAKSEKITIDLLVNGKDVKKATKSVDGLNASVDKVSKSSRMASGQVDRMNKSLLSAKNNTSSFAKQAQGLGGLVHVYATIAANIFALSAAYSVLKNNADLTIMAKSAEELSLATGINFARSAKNMQKLTGGALSFAQAMRQANLALSSGASLGQVEQITTIANKAANALGISVPEAVSRMTQAVVKGEPELVDEFGIILRVTEATNAYAQSIGKAANKLTTFEKSQAIMNQLIEQGTAKFGAATKQTNPYDQLGASFTDLTNTIVGGISTAIGPAISMLAGNVTLLLTAITFGVLSLGKKVIPSIADISTTFSDKAAKAADDAESAAKRAADSILKIAKNRENRQDFADFSTKDIGDIAGSISRDMGVKFRKNSGLAKALAEGIGGPQLLKELKAQGIDEKINAAINRSKTSDKASIFGLNVQDNEDDLQFLSALVGSQTSKLQDTIKGSYFAAEKRAELYKKRVSEIHKTAFTGFSKVIQASGLSNIYKATASSVKNLYAQVKKANPELSRLQSTMVRMKGTGAIAVTTLLGVGKGLAGVVSKLGIWGATAAIAYESIIKGLGFFDLYDEKAVKLSKSLIAQSDISKEIATDFKDLSDTQIDMSDKSSIVAAKLQKVSGVMNQLTTNINKLGEALIAVKPLSTIEGFFAFVASGTTEEGRIATSIEALRTNLVRAAELSGSNEVSIKLRLPNLLNVEAAEKSLLALQDRTTEVFHNIKRSIRTETLTRTGAIPNAAGILKEVNRRISVQKTLLAESKAVALRSVNALDPSVALASMGKGNPQSEKNILAYIDKALELNRIVQNNTSMFNDSSTAIGDMDKILTDLGNKSESRRILNVDTTIDLLKGLTTITENAVGLTKAGKFDSLASIFGKIPEELRKGLKIQALSANFDELSNEQKTKEVKQVIASTNLAKDALAINLQILATSKSRISLLSKEAELYAIQLKAGKAGSFIDVAKAERDILKEKLKIADATINNKIVLSKLLPKELETHNAAIAAAIAAKAVLEEKLKVQHLVAGSIKEESAELAKQTGILNANKANKVAEASLLASVVKLDKVSLLNAKNLAGYEAQKIARSRSLAQDKLNLLKADVRRLKLGVDLKDAENTIAGRVEASIKAKTKLIEGQVLLNELKHKELLSQREIFDLTNKATGVNGASSANAFALGDNFTDRLSIELGYAATDMATKISNSVKNYATYITDATANLSETLVDGLINNDWDGKKEGASLWTAMREGLKTTLRESIGSAIKKNMTNALTNLAALLFKGKTAEELAAIAAARALDTNTIALQFATAATNRLTAQGALGGSGSGLEKVLNLGLKGYGKNGGPAPIVPDFAEFATGGVVHKPTNALIGEGKNSEAVVPLPNNRSIPVELKGGGGTTVSIAQTFDFSGANKDSEAKLLQYASRIKEETIREITNNINRGGSLSKVVGRR